METERFDWFLAKTREFNTGIHQKPWEGGYLPWPVLEEFIVTLSERAYLREPHWHSVQGKCIDKLPFEIIMMQLSLLSSAWVADIYLRKARDRAAPIMEERYLAYRAYLLNLLKFIEMEVKSNRDEAAEQAYQGSVRRIKGPGKVAHWLSRMLWRH